MGSKNKKCQGFKSNVKSLDQFGKPISFALEDGKQTYDTYCGAFLTLTILALAVIMAVQLVFKNEPIRAHPIETNQDRYPSDIFSAKENKFNVAFAMAPFNPDVTFIDDGKVAQLKPYIHSWGVDNTGTRFSKLTPLDYELCSTLELGVNMQGDQKLKDQSKFYPPQNANPKDIKQIANQFQCIDVSEINLYGNYDSMEGSALVINLELCQGNGCRTVDIEEFFQDLFILTYTNQKKYEITPEDGLKNHYNSFLSWIPISTQVRSSFKYEVRTHRFMPDRNLFGMFEEDRTFFEINQKMVIPSTERRTDLMTVSFEMAVTTGLLQSYTYGFTDLIKDVGGFLFIVTIIASGINSLFVYNKRMNWAVSELFRKKQTGKWMPEGETENLKFSPFSQSAIKDCMRGFCCCLRTRKSRQDRIFNAGRKSVKRNINILHFIRFTRFMERVIQARIPEKIQSTLQERLRRVTLDSFSEPSSDSNADHTVKASRGGDENDDDIPQLDIFSGRASEIPKGLLEHSQEQQLEPAKAKPKNNGSHSQRLRPNKTLKPGRKNSKEALKGRQDQKRKLKTSKTEERFSLQDNIIVEEIGGADKPVNLKVDEPSGMTRLQTLRQAKKERQKKYNEMNEIDPEAIASDILTLQQKELRQ